MQQPTEQKWGALELERGMTPGRTRDALKIGLIAVAMLVVFNSAGLAKWTQSLPSNSVCAWLAETASDWDQAMRHWGPAGLFEQLRERFKIE